MLLIRGEWVEGEGESFTKTDPSTGQTSWQGSAASQSQVKLAVEAARAAQPEWHKLGFGARKEILERFASSLEGQLGDQLLDAISQEAGKPRWEAKTEVGAVKGKVAASIRGSRRQEPIEASGPTAQIRTEFKPVGVLAVLGPFNFPAHMSNGHIIPALLAGNTIVLKPSPFTPRSAEVHVRALLEAGVPDGVINLLQGGADVAMHLVDEDIDGLCLTGSQAAGAAIHKALAGRPEVMLALELGGVSPFIVWSYNDIRAALLATVQSAFATAGQRCNCARRLIVAESIAPEFITRLVETSKQLRIGPPGQEPAPFMGPLISEVARQAFLEGQQRLIRMGGQVLLEAAPLPGPGCFVSPGLIDMTGVPQILDEEIFGPLLQVHRVKTLDEACGLANNTRFGLTAGILSTERTDFELMTQLVGAGLLNWNQPLTGASGLASFGGVKLSGNHRPAGLLAADYVVDGVAITAVELLKLPESLPAGVEL